jgi:uncharacterized protein (TIGR02996 family)
MPPSRTAEASPEYRGLLDAIVECGADAAPRLILADWLEEHDRPHEAELLRLHVSLLETCCDPEKHPERVRQQARIVELLAAGVRPCVPLQTIALAEGVDMTFAWIPPGTFRMGSPPEEPEREEDETLHEVTLTQGFYLGIHAVTQAQWQAVMSNNPSRFKGRKRQDKNRPVEQVSWEDCQAFCTKLSEREGKRYGLPSEAEWEYACRAGTTTPFFFGDTLSTDQANYDGNYPYNKGGKGVYRKRTTPVGSFPPNAWGLFDMHGNIWEWCQDEYISHEYQNTKSILDTENTDESACVLRGGSWNGFARDCRAADRGRIAPSVGYDVSGFRVAFRLD